MVYYYLIYSESKKGLQLGKEYQNVNCKEQVLDSEAWQEHSQRARHHRFLHGFLHSF